MKSQFRESPRFSPALLAGIGLGAVPPVLFQPFFDALLVVMKRRHAGMFSRLECMAGSSFRIDPTDLPFDFVLAFAPAPRLKAVAKGVGGEAVTASIHAPLLTLTNLLEGKLDADALFFSRDLVVAGDTEAVVMLRNFIDGAGINIAEDVLWASGPFSPPVKAAARGAGAVIARMNKDIDLLNRALLAPFAERQDRQAAEIRELRAMVTELQRKAAPPAAARRRGRKTAGQ